MTSALIKIAVILLLFELSNPAIDATKQDHLGPIKRTDPHPPPILPATPIVSLKPPQLTDPRGRIHYKTTYACEGRQLDLSCDEGRMIHLVRANYGRFSLSICNPTGQLDLSVNCMSFRSFLIMQDKCSQTSNCSVLVSSKMFGDPCPGTSKYLEVQYHCVHPSSAPDAYGSTKRPMDGMEYLEGIPKSDTNDLSNFGQGLPSTSNLTSSLNPVPVIPKMPSKVSTSTTAPTSTTQFSITTSRTRTPTAKPSTSLPSVSHRRANDEVTSFRGSQTVNPSNNNRHHGHGHGLGQLHRSSQLTPPGDILKTIPAKNIPIPPRPPEVSLPPWLDASLPSNADLTNRLHFPIDGSSGGQFVDPRLAGTNNMDGFEDGSGTSSPQEEDDDMIIMAVTVFVIVFFLVLTTFGLLFCLLRSDSVRGRKFVRQLPFINCLFGGDVMSHDSDSQGEKVSSVVYSSAYGSTTTGVIGFPIVDSRVPTRIPSMDSPTSLSNTMKHIHATSHYGLRPSLNYRNYTTCSQIQSRSQHPYPLWSHQV